MTDGATAAEAIPLRERLAPLLEPLVGLVRAPVPIPFPPGLPSIPVITAGLGDLSNVLPSCQEYHRRLGVPVNDLDGGGGDLDPGWATSLAVAEALERYCSAAADRRDLRWAKATELAPDVLDLGSLPRLSEHELALPGQMLRRPDPGVPRHWVRGIRLRDTRPTWLPAALVYLYLLPLHDQEVITSPVSTGCAADPNPVAAILRGLVEVVERDAAVLVWRQQMPLPEIDVDCGDRSWRDLLSRYDRHPDVDLRLFDATTDVGLPVVYAVRVDRSNSRLRHVVACAADIDPVRAAVKAVREALTSHLSLLADTAPVPKRPEDCWTTSDGGRYMADAERSDAFAFLLRPAPPRRLLTQLPTPPAEAAPALSWLVRRVTAAGSETYAVDLTTLEAEATGMTVIRAIAPGLQPLSFQASAQFLGHPRLYAAPAAMGYPVHQEERLSPWPQPIV